MAYENVTYLDASNECQKTFLKPNEFIYNPDFPTQKTKELSRNTGGFAVNERWSAHFNGKPYKRTFSQAVINEPTKKIIIQKSYDKHAHNKALLCPNGRMSHPIFLRPPLVLLSGVGRSGRTLSVELRYEKIWIKMPPN